MLHSEHIDKIAPAFLAAQKAVRAVQRTKINPHFQQMYAPLEEVMDAAKEACHVNDIAIIQSQDPGDGMTVATTLMHTSGQWYRGFVRVPIEKSTPQAAGSAMTYGRRYGLAAIMAIVSDWDDDGNEARAPQKNRRAATKGLKRDAESYSDAELHEMKARFIKENRGAHVAKINAELARRSQAEYSEVPKGLRTPQAGLGVTRGNQ